MEAGLALDNIFLRWKLLFFKIESNQTYVQRGIGVHVADNTSILLGAVTPLPLL
jgi:hypothetical protein